jgi:hypothetical protein
MYHSIASRLKRTLNVNGQKNTKVVDLLLEFSKLEEREREQFLERINRYIFVSPKGQRKLRLTWKAKTLKTVMREDDCA